MERIAVPALNLKSSICYQLISYYELLLIIKCTVIILLKFKIDSPEHHHFFANNPLNYYFIKVKKIQDKSKNESAKAKTTVWGAKYPPPPVYGHDISFI